MNFIILCAGKSKKNTIEYNKSTLNYKRKPILIRQINTIKKVYKTPRIVCVTGFDSNKIKDLTKDHKITYVHNNIYEDTFTFYSLYLAAQEIIGSAYIIHNDIVFNPAHIQNKKEKNTIWVSKGKNKSIGVNIFNKRVMGFSYGLDTLWQKMVFLDEATIDKLKTTTIIKKDMNKMDFEYYNHLIENGTYFMAVQGKLKEIKTHKDI